MRIALRTSGGRGEYELAGSQGGVKNSDLFGLPLRFEVTPDKIMDGLQHVEVKEKQGKPRIRLLDERQGVHAYRLLAGLLLLPKPIREIARTGEGPLEIETDKYSISSIDVDVVGRTRADATLRPTQIELRNESGEQKSFLFAQRMARITRIWVAARQDPTSLGLALQEHERTVSKGHDLKAPEKITAHIMRLLGISDDPLPLIERKYSLSIETDQLLAEDIPPAPDEDETTPLEASQRQIMLWRLQAARGPAGKRFSSVVKDAYNFRCLFSGTRLPKTEHLAVPGVEAAHILPWNQYDLDNVRNGLCLNKLCHWAFDNGLLRLDYAAQTKKYFISVPDKFVHHAQSANVDLEYFLGLQGEVPQSRLPSDPQSWPNPEYLAELNSKLFPL